MNGGGAAPDLGSVGVVDHPPDGPLHYQARHEVDITLNNRSRVSPGGADAEKTG